MENYKIELESLRLEFLKRSTDAGAIWLAERALEHKKKPAVIYEGADFRDGANHEFTITLTVNLYAPLEEIEQGLSNVLERIKWNKELLAFDNPESAIKPGFEQGRGKRSPETTIEDLKLCLRIFDLAAQDKKPTEIAREVYPGDADLDSSRNKVKHHIKKALKLVEASKTDKFPKIS